MRVTIELEDSDQVGRAFFYWALVKSGAKSLPLQTPSQWFYEVGKALYYISDKDISEALVTLGVDKSITVEPADPIASI